MENNFLIVNCAYCGKELKLWPSQKRSKLSFCSRTCDSLYKRGRAKGKYSDYQVNAMVEGKKQAYLSRVLEMEKSGKYDIKRIKYILDIVPISNTRQLAKLLGFREDIDGHSPSKELKYLLEYYNLTDKLKKEKFPECYTVAQPEQLIWLNSILSKSNNFYEFTSLFLQEYKSIGLRKACCEYKHLILYVQYLSIKTGALREDLSKNLQMCGTSCEIKMRQILDEIGCNYQEQKLIDYKRYLVPGETKERWSRFKPDFIIDDKFIIEVNGDYWHAYNVAIEDMNRSQIERTHRDIEKYQFYKEHDYRFIVVWEHDLANIYSIKNRIQEEISNEWNYKTIIYH